MQGKSTFLQAIRWCILGGNDDYFIRHGNNTCEVILESDTGARMERRLTRGGTSKFFIYQDERPLEKPQELANTLFNQLLFSPTDMLLMKPKDLNETITTAISKRLKLTEEQIKIYKLQSLDLSKDPVEAIQKYYDQLYAERTEVNRTVKALEIKTGSKIYTAPTSEELQILEIEVKNLKTKIDQAKEFNVRLEISKKNADIKQKTETNIKILEKEILDGNNILLKTDEFAALLIEQEKKLSQLQSAINNDKTEYNNIDKTLQQLGHEEITCPIHPLIKCTVDMKPYKSTLCEKLEQIKTVGKSRHEEAVVLGQSIAKLKTDIENGKNLKSKILELERAKSILNELEIISGSVIDVENLEKELKEKNDLLSRGKLAVELSKISGLEEGRKRQTELEELLASLNVLIKQVIPGMLTLNVKGVTISKEGLFYQGLPFYRLGDSFKLRLCTAILKDLYPKANLFVMDRMECIDKIQIKKYIETYSKENTPIQYIGSYVGFIDEVNTNTEIFTVENFKVVKNA